MPKSKYAPVKHNQKEMLAKALKRKGFSEAYNSLELEYSVAREMLQARLRAGLTQQAVADKMGTTKSAVSRLESAGKYTPSMSSLKKYAEAVGCELEVHFHPQKSA